MIPRSPQIVASTTLPARPVRPPMQPTPSRKPAWRTPRWGKIPFRTPLAMGLTVALLLVGIVVGTYILGGGVELRSLEQHLANAGTGDPTNEEVSSSTLIGQSFRSPKANLSRIQLQLTGYARLPEEGRVRLLLGDGLDGTPIYDAPLSAARFNNPYISIPFPPISASEGATYTLLLETTGKPINTAFPLGYHASDALSAGSMYTDAGAERGDLTFSLYYRYDLAALAGDVGRTLANEGALILSWLLLLLLPGLALLAWLPNSLSAGAKLLAAPGLTALTLPVFFLVTRALGLPSGGPAMWVLLVLCAGALVAWVARVKPRPRLRLRGVPPADIAFWGLLAAVFMATLATRLMSLRDASAGMNIDAYHHTLIATMFAESGGIPSNYKPYAPLESFTYHFGFHALTATVGWLAGRTAPTDIMLLMPQAGQVASALPVLSLTVFGWRALGNRWAGLAAGTLAGLISIFPAFYVNWSRYTQGLALALLPIAWVLLLEVLDRPSRQVQSSNSKVQSGETEAQSREAEIQNPKLALEQSEGSKIQNQITWASALRQSGPYMLAVLGAAGLALTHYRIAMIYATFAFLYVGWRVVRAWRARKPGGEYWTLLRRVCIVAALSLATLLPWLLNLAQNFTRQFVGQDNPAAVQYYSLERTLGGTDLTFHPSHIGMFVFALGGVVLAGKKRQFLPIAPALAWLILGLWSNPYLLPVRLPFAGYLDATTLVIGAWLPLTILAGYALAEVGRLAFSLGDNLSRAQARVWRVGFALLLGTAVLTAGSASSMGLSARLDGKPYIAPADREALLWMRDNLPRDAYVLANPFGYGWSRSLHGSDAGLWVPMVAGVRASVPPMPAYNERPTDPNYTNNLLDLLPYEPWTSQKVGDEDYNALLEAGITHVYVGSRGGALSVPDLLASDRTQLVFHKDATWVFELR